MERKIKIVYKRLPNKVMEIESTLLHESEDIIVTTHILSGASSPIVINGEVVLDNGYRAVFFEFCNEWHDIAKIYNREDKFTGYYCDINTPTKRFKGGYETLDLCLDLWIYPNSKIYIVLDEDEFKEAVKKGWIDKKMAKKARDTLTMLINQINKGDFPPPIVREFKIQI
ncbi:MAG TPA: DUF402 domain-containing protein [bacterium (Candidatus Stahlbacteria)]|nr:DUF402 domain-containing protein [Candidatus Stahlbacteria bacterium]